MIYSFNILNQWMNNDCIYFCILYLFLYFVNIDKTEVCASVKSIKSLSLSLSNSFTQL